VAIGQMYFTARNLGASGYFGLTCFSNQSRTEKHGQSFGGAPVLRIRSRWPPMVVIEGKRSRRDRTISSRDFHCSGV
jgi:hypothetical protein